MATIEPGRRAVIAAAAAAALLRPAAASALDLAAPADRLRAYMLMRGALDGRLVAGCVSGRYYGVVGSEVRPLYGVVGATFARFRQAEGGGYDGASYEVPFFTDLDTGAVLDRWPNPYTGEEVSVPAPGFPPSRIAISPSLELTLPSPPPGLTLDHRVLPAETMGDDVWMTEETFTSMSLPGRSEPVRYTEMLTLHARRSDLDAPGAARVPCQTGFLAVVSWRPWQKMGDRPGHLTGHGAGRYGVPMEEMPAAWLRAASERRPEVLKDPGAPLDALLKG